MMLKRKKLTEKRKAYIDQAWPQFKTYIDAMKAAGFYKGLQWSGDPKQPKKHLDTKEQFTEELLTNHSIHFQFRMEIR